MEPGIILGFVLAIMIVLSVPIAMSLGLASLAGILVMSTDFLLFLPQKFINGIDSFTLLAIPLFILAGIVTDPIAAVSALAEPQTPEKNIVEIIETIP